MLRYARIVLTVVVAVVVAVAVAGTGALERDERAWLSNRGAKESGGVWAMWEVGKWAKGAGDLPPLVGPKRGEGAPMCAAA